MPQIFAILIALVIAATSEARADLGISTRMRDDGSVVLQCKLSRKLLKRTRSSVLLIVRDTGEVTKIRSKKKRCKFIQSLDDASIESYRVGVKLTNGQTTWSDIVAVVDENGAIESIEDIPSQDPNSTSLVDEDFTFEDPEEPTSTPESPTRSEPPFDLSGNCSEYASIALAQRTNEARQAQGKIPLDIDASLMKSAHVHSQVMASTGSLTHDGWYEQVLDYGFTGTTSGQNIAGGYPTAEQALDAFMGSPSHRMNILSEKFTKIGIGCVEDAAGKRWWTQNFGG